MSRDLFAFLNARLAEDEASARDGRYVWPTSFEVTLNPDRVLREVEVKRAIIGLHRNGNVPDSCSYCHEGWPCRTLRILAAVYSDHPDYSETVPHG